MKKIFGLVLGMVTLANGAFAAVGVQDAQNDRTSMYRRTSDNITVVNNFKFSGRTPNAMPVVQQPEMP